MITRVEISARAEKELRQLPEHLKRKLDFWVGNVEEISLEETRKISGFHDEPLQGKRFGQRSIRLNRAYRAVYRLCRDEIGKYALIEEVHKHDY